MNMRSLLLAGVALSMGACVAAPAAAPTPTAAPPATRVPIAQPTVVVVAKPTQPPVAAAPTATFERVAEQEPRVAAPQPHGLVTWRDDTLRNDSLLVSAEDLPTLPRGQVYAAWLAGQDNSVFLGTLAPGAGGANVLSYAATDHANLLGDFDRLTISRVSPTESGQPSTNAVLDGGLPAQALIHMRHVLVGIPSTPNGTGFVLGLRDQTEEMLRHAQFLQEAQVEGNLANEKLHAEHLVNLIEGQHGEHYGDLNGNGRVDDPGDGYGVLPNGADGNFGYINGMRDHTELAANAPDATPEIKLHAGHVQIAADNTQVRTTEIRDRALELLETRSTSDTRSDVQRVLALAQQTIVGLDLNGDEQIAPVPGEGGVMVAYQHAQLMAGIVLSRPTVAAAADRVAPAPTATAIATSPASTAITIGPTAALTAAKLATTQPLALAPVRLVITDNAYSNKSLSVPVGATVVWSHEGQKPHTVTADDDSFKSEPLKNGQTFELTFSQPGTFLYYCELHGGAGGEGMSARVQVQ
jgi:plastocyanin